MRLIFELSGEHPEIPFAEIESVGIITDREMQVAVAECVNPADAGRLAMTHNVMEYLGECHADAGSFGDLLDSLGLSAEGSFAGRVKKIAGTSVSESQLALEKIIGSKINGSVSLNNPDYEYRAVFSGERCFFGKVICRIDRGGFSCRNPMRRPFFHPGVMMPLFARTMVNLSLAVPCDHFYDPFCGTGGIMLEAKLLGCRISGGDMDHLMLGGCRQNLPDAELFRTDASSMPFGDETFDAVATDLPYGQSVCIMGGSLDKLYDSSLSEIRRILKPKRRAVVVTHNDVRGVAEEYFTVKDYFEQRVHKSLTRRVMVLE
jgi:tRNA (guanine10-N2)-dimethyltransferase